MILDYLYISSQSFRNRKLCKNKEYIEYIQVKCKIGFIIDMQMYFIIRKRLRDFTTVTLN